MDKSKKIAILLISFLVTITFATAASAQYDDWPDEWGSDEAAFFMGLGLTVCIIIVVVPLIIAILTCIWIYKDAEKRGKSGALWVLLLIILTLFLSFIGLIITIVVWLAIRPPITGTAGHVSQPGTPASARTAESDRRCPNCGRIIPMDARACPYCAKKFDQ